MQPLRLADITPVAEPLLIDAKAARRLLGISERLLRNLTVPRGPIPVVQVSQRSIRYRPEDLAAWIASRRVTG